MPKEICEKNTCTACNACVVICPRHCISMRKDDMDSLQPYIDDSECINCGLCSKICPNHNKLNWKTDKVVYAAWSNDRNTRLTSASGGIAAELYKYYLDLRGFSVGVSFNEKHEAIFRQLTRIEDIKQIQNSKYVYSNTLDLYKHIKVKLLEGKQALFIALPCQVAGLLSYLGKEYDNLLTVDLVCHGVVSTTYFQQHITKIEKSKHKKTQFISFRDPEFNTNTYALTLRDKEKSIFFKKSI